MKAVLFQGSGQSFFRHKKIFCDSSVLCSKNKNLAAQISFAPNLRPFFFFASRGAKQSERRLRSPILPKIHHGRRTCRHIIWVLGMESCWCGGYQCPKLFIYPPECTAAPLAAMPMSQSEQGEEEEEGGGGARCSPSGPHGPFFMIFLYLDLLFWNQIFTWDTEGEKFVLSHWQQLHFYTAD